MASNKKSGGPLAKTEELDDKKTGTEELDDKKTGWSLDDKPVKIDKWDTAALKNALDDAAKKVMLEGFCFKESHYLFDVRLLICTIAVLFSLFALGWDYVRPFPESRPVLILCVVLYFTLMGVLTLYTTYKEKGIFLVAIEKDKAGMDPDDVWELASALKKYDHNYHLSITLKVGKSRKSRSMDVTKSVAEYFDENGVLCFDKFEPEVRILKTKVAESKQE